MPIHYFKHGRRHCPNGEDPIPCMGKMAAFRALRTSNFTVVDGSYYAFAQTEGADPSAYGEAATFEFFNDAGDGTGVFNTEAVGTGEVLKFQASSTADRLYMVAYDAGVVFTASVDTTTVTASLYLGRGVGGGTYSEEHASLEAVAGSEGAPTLRLTGSIPVTGGYVDGVLGSDTATTPTISPILLVEGGTPTVDKAWCYFTVLTEMVAA